jgi:hypothetical protein
MAPSASTNPPVSKTQEYYFSGSDAFSVNNISFTNISLFDYCQYKHPLNRSQRYFFCTGQGKDDCFDSYREYIGCPARNNFNYRIIPNSFTPATTNRDDPTNFLDFDNSIDSKCSLKFNMSFLSAMSFVFLAITCVDNTIRRVFYRFNYTSTTNTLLSAEVFVLLLNKSESTRITIEWNDLSTSSASNQSTSIHRTYSIRSLTNNQCIFYDLAGYTAGEVLHFRRSNNPSDVSILIPSRFAFVLLTCHRISTLGFVFFQKRTDCVLTPNGKVFATSKVFHQLVSFNYFKQL